MFKGTGTALITPFEESFEVDYQALKKLIRFQLEGGINSLVVLGTTGEAATIDDEERRKIVETVIVEVDRQVPVIIGTGTNDTKKVVENNKIAEDFKADGLLIVNPYYNKGTQAGLVEHYRYIAERTNLPILIYNVPSRTSMNLLPETVLKIHEVCPNVIGVKEASGDISQIARLMAMKPEDFLVFSGNDDQTIPIMALGGNGVISVFSNVFPGVMVSITDAIFKGDWALAREINAKYLKIMNDLFIETNPIPVKFALSLLGYCKNVLRLPLTKATEKTSDILMKSISR
ncbi:MAG: 4-hydroxy-tetrahydrodipicolinate synthase [Ignavibacteria bacterium]|jgi:4-hydroxy-tetrahydrodipicolinate synthase|nr:4-hydroxy-tetrahydrodipicolinate synthase [Ignavibacteria bacterium]MCU7503891.1 4-hydroxy-tetrahydrodipicolinate synthase [Ignavibacteria bacterium]MCU7515888.1 4-hydroxy-tetrahydrodipicolinate synthase [Ignavibacteria bacterium]